MIRTPSKIVFNVDEAQAAADAWNFNCGPGALCAVLNVGPETIRPHLCGFEKKGYTNPLLMFEILKGLGLKWENLKTLPDFGLVRVQWDGPWCDPGRPLKARYRHTHWIAVCGQEIFDINATCAGGWLSYHEWDTQLIPWLLKEVEPKASGRWWPTHNLSLDRVQCARVGLSLKNGKNKEQLHGHENRL